MHSNLSGTKPHSNGRNVCEHSSVIADLALDAENGRARRAILSWRICYWMVLAASSRPGRGALEGMIYWWSFGSGLCMCRVEQHREAYVFWEL